MFDANDPEQDTFDDFADESTDDQDEIEKPDGVEEGMLDGLDLDFGEEDE